MPVLCSSCGQPVRPTRLKTAGAAAYLQRNVHFVYRLVGDSQVPYLKVGNELQFEYDDLDAYLAACRIERGVLR